MNLKNRYLSLLKNSLLNEIYIENDVRLLYLFAMLESRQPIDMNAFRSPAALLASWHSRIKEARQDGRIWWRVDYLNADGTPGLMNLRNACEFSHTMIGRKRLENIEQCINMVRDDDVPGDLAETGVWRGGAAIFMRGCLAAHEMNGRNVWVADSFEGLPVPSAPQDQGHDYSASVEPILAISLEEVAENFRRYDLLDDRVKFLKGWFKDTLHKSPIQRLAVLRLDGDLYESTMDALNALYDKVSPGGFILVDDYNDFEPCRRAIEEFRSSRSITDRIMQVDWSGVYWRKSANS